MSPSLQSRADKGAHSSNTKYDKLFFKECKSQNTEKHKYTYNVVIAIVKGDKNPANIM